MDVANNEEKSPILVENELEVDDCKENISEGTAMTSMMTDNNSDLQNLKCKHDLGKKEKYPVTFDNKEIPTAENENMVQDKDLNNPATKSEPLDPAAVEEALKMIREFKPKKSRGPLPLFPGRIKKEKNSRIKNILVLNVKIQKLLFFVF